MRMARSPPAMAEPNLGHAWIEVRDRRLGPDRERCAKIGPRAMQIAAIECRDLRVDEIDVGTGHADRVRQARKWRRSRACRGKPAGDDTIRLRNEKMRR
jgi:hypothetical protein